MDNQIALDALKNPTPRDFFILDIDSTLVTTHQRNQAILNDWIKANQTLYPKDCDQLKKTQCQFGDYGLKHALQRANFSEKHPGSQKNLDQFWRENFFSNKYLHSDVATRGAVHWTQSLEEMGVEFIYLTARHKTTMWEGTLSSLDAMGFPISQDILFLKEDLSLSDEDYKNQLMGQWVEKHKDRKLWFIDNEPLVLHKIKDHHPSVNLIWFESTHSGKVDPPQGLLKINNFHFS